MALFRPIEDYDDYRDVVRDWYLAEKAASRAMSYRYLARRLGLSAPNHLHLVASKKRHLSRAVFVKLRPMLKLKPRERAFFELLFDGATGRDPGAKAAIDGKLARLRASRSDADGVADDYALLSNSIAWFLVMGAPLFDRLSRAEVIAKACASCRFPIAPADVEAALDFLLKQGKLTEKAGQLTFPTEHYRTGWDLDRDEIKGFHRANLRLGLQAVALPANERFLSNVTFAADAELIDMTKREIRDLCMKILEASDRLASSTNDAANDRVTSVTSLQFAMVPFFSTKKP